MVYVKLVSCEGGMVRTPVLRLCLLASHSFSNGEWSRSCIYSCLVSQRLLGMTRMKNA